MSDNDFLMNVELASQSFGALMAMFLEATDAEEHDPAASAALRRQIVEAFHGFSKDEVVLMMIEALARIATISELANDRRARKRPGMVLAQIRGELGGTDPDQIQGEGKGNDGG